MRQWRMFSTDRSGAQTRCPESITLLAPMPCSVVHDTGLNSNYCTHLPGVHSNGIWLI